MKYIVSFGKIELKYFIMIGCAIAFSFVCRFSYLLYSEQKEEIIKNEIDDDDLKKKTNNALLKSFLKYVGFSLFIIGEILRKRISFGREKEQKINQNVLKALDLNKDLKKDMHLITFKDILIIVFISFLHLLDEFLAILTKILGHVGSIKINEVYNTIEFTFLFFISYLIFKLHYYKHQYISIIIIILAEVFQIILKLITDTKKINIFLTNSGIQLFRAFIDSIFIGYSKALMEYKYFSPYKALSIFGFINGIIMIIIYIIFNFIPIDPKSQFCSIMYEGKCYFDNLNSIFNGFNFVQFIGLFLYMIATSGTQLLFNFIVNDYTICHIFPYFIVIAFYEIFKETSLILIISIIICSIEFLISLIFLEIIILNFCGLNKNVKKNIEKRAKLDYENQFNDHKEILDINDDYEITENGQNEEIKENNSLKLTALLPIDDNDSEKN